MQLCQLKAVTAALTASVLGVVILGSTSYSQTPHAAGEQASTSSESVVTERVKAALHADPYVYDEHIDVSMKNGSVVLKGFVSSDWDLRNAIRIATQAAGGRRVIDSLTIKEGGVR